MVFGEALAFAIEKDLEKRCFGDAFVYRLFQEGSLVSVFDGFLRFLATLISKREVPRSEC